MAPLLRLNPYVAFHRAFAVAALERGLLGRATFYLLTPAALAGASSSKGVRGQPRV